MSNKRAILPANKARLEVVNADVPKPEKGEILVKNTYFSSNPVDWKIQHGYFDFFELKYPLSMGSDLTGIVEEVGEGTRFKKGDRVFSWSPYLVKKNLTYGAFQNYTITPADTTGLIPDNVTEEAAITFCLPLLTSLSALYYCLALDRPPLSRDLVGTKEYIWINAGSSAVGSTGIQLAALSGYKVLTTSSPKNFDLVKSLGATEVWDYSDPELVSKVKKFLNGTKIRYAYDADSRLTSVNQAAQILNYTGSLALVLPKPEEAIIGEVKYDDTHTFRTLADPDLRDWWFNWIEPALHIGLLKPLRIEVIAHGVESAQDLLDYHASGKVSASKPVIKL